MATNPIPHSLFDAGIIAGRWLTDYCGDRPFADVLCAARGDDREAWRIALEELAAVSGEALDDARDRVQRHAGDIGTGFRVAGEPVERPWPLSPLPLLIGADEWAGIARGVAQRAELIETIVADIYGDGRLVAGGHLPAALVTGSPQFLRPMVGLVPPGGYQIHFYAADLCRGPSGEWRVLGDDVRAPVGAGYALENRLAVARTLGGLQSRLNIERHAPFFAAFRDGLATVCRRAEPRIGLLTPGRLNPSYAEQAHLARYLGFLLVEGADLAVREDQLYVRTIAGMKRVDALWRRVDPRFLDPLAFDSTSQIGVAGLIDAMALGNVVLSSSPGAGVVESAALMAFLPRLARRLTGEDLLLPNVATWWCGGAGECAEVIENLDRLVIAPAFGAIPRGLPVGRPVLGSALVGEARAALLADLERRPQDYVGQEVVRLSTMPVVGESGLTPRPFTLRVFAARDASGAWTVLPGGFARIGEHPDERAAVMGEGTWSADVCIHGPDPVDTTSLLPAADSVHLRRNPGTLPSRVADNLFWLGRYLERGEALLAVIRVLLGHSIGADTGSALTPDTLWRLIGLITAAGAAPAPASTRRGDLSSFVKAAMEGVDAGQSVRMINRQARGIGEGSRDRLAADMIRLLEAPHPTRGHLLDRAGSLQRRYAALAGLSAEHMARTDGWRFQDLGRRIERAITTSAAIRALGGTNASADDLSTLLDLANSQISYRQRYLTGIARVPVIDLVALDPGNPRGLAYQVAAIGEHLAKLPVLDDDGLAEPQQALAVELAALIATARATSLDDTQLYAIETRLFALSNAIARRYFLQGAEPLRASGDDTRLMRYNIRHVTRFDYAAAAGFARCNLRLKPIHWSGQTLDDYNLSVTPGGETYPARAEAGLANVTRLVIGQPTRTLTIESRCRVTVERLIPTSASDDPSLADVAEAARASRDMGAASPAAYLFASPRIALDPDIADWCAAELDPDRGALDAAIALARAIQRDFDFDPAATLVDTPPHEAFERRHGVCQDFAQIMISGLRSAGLPAAYASGYLRTLPPPGQPRLVGADATHAWVLLWCGAERGWVGVDPTNGIWMAEDHVVMAIGRDYADIAPIDGIVLGSGAQKMTVSVDVEPLDITPELRAAGVSPT